MSTSQPEAIKKQVKIYWAVFAALTVGTILTVLVAGVKLGILVGIVAALIIATIKGSLVAGYFMHLFHERKLIYFILALTAVFVLVMVGVIMWTASDQQGANQGIFPVAPHRVTPGVTHGETHPE
jgi:caa(3)-type oxidase subunit IV